MTVNQLVENLQSDVARRPSVGDLEIIHFDDMDVSRSIDSIQVNRDDVILMNNDREDHEE